MKIKAPKHGVHTVHKKDLQKWVNDGWLFDKDLGGNAFQVRKTYSKWEQFEVRVRALFKAIGFDHCIEDPSDFHYTELGPQVDVCGGVGRYFVVIDCTQSDRGKVSIKSKIRENHAKRGRILDAIRKKGWKYDQLVMGVCVDGDEVTGPDEIEASHLGITIIDRDFFERCVRYTDSLGASLKYQILRRMNVTEIVDDGNEKFFEFPAIALTSGSRTLFSFCAPPEALIQLAYVHRVDRLDDQGYQRELKHAKLKNLNTFLCENGYFANNLVMCFDTKNLLSFVDLQGKKMPKPRAGQMGRVRIPKQYCCAELIDGQHRLYGYLDFTGEADMSRQLKERRRGDTLNVVAVEDPGENERPILFVDINSNQTRVSVRDIWALMARIKPTSQIGHIAGVVIALNHKGPLKGKIYIPGVNSGQGKVINIANVGKGIKDRNILTNQTASDPCKWNLFVGDRNATEYPKHPSQSAISALNSYFSIIRDSAKDDWKRQDKGFLLTNNGLNIALRVYAELLKHFYLQREKPTPKAIRRVIGSKFGDFIERRNHKKLRKNSSSEAARAEIADDICRFLNISTEPKVKSATAKS